jgi:hypothetical protein
VPKGTLVKEDEQPLAAESLRHKAAEPRPARVVPDLKECIQDWSRANGDTVSAAIGLSPARGASQFRYRWQLLLLQLLHLIVVEPVESTEPTKSMRIQSE